MRNANDLKLGSRVWAITYKNNSTKIQKESFYVSSLTIEGRSLTLVIENKHKDRSLKVSKRLMQGDVFEQLQEITKLYVEDAPFLYKNTIFLQTEDLNKAFKKNIFEKLIETDKILFQIHETWGKIGPKPLIHFNPPTIPFGELTMKHEVAILFLDDVTLHFTKPGSLRYVWDNHYTLSLIHRENSSEFKGSLNEVVWEGELNGKRALLAILNKDRSNGYGIVKLYRKRLLNEKRKLSKKVNR